MKLRSWRVPASLSNSQTATLETSHPNAGEASSRESLAEKKLRLREQRKKKFESYYEEFEPKPEGGCSPGKRVLLYRTDVAAIPLDLSDAPEEDENETVRLLQNEAPAAHSNQTSPRPENPSASSQALSSQGLQIRNENQIPAEVSPWAIKIATKLQKFTLHPEDIPGRPRVRQLLKTFLVDPRRMPNTACSLEPFHVSPKSFPYEKSIGLSKFNLRTMGFPPQVQGRSRLCKFNADTRIFPKEAPVELKRFNVRTSTFPSDVIDNPPPAFQHTSSNVVADQARDSKESPSDVIDTQILTSKKELSDVIDIQTPEWKNASTNTEGSLAQSNHVDTVLEDKTCDDVETQVHDKPTLSRFEISPQNFVPVQSRKALFGNAEQLRAFSIASCLFPSSKEASLPGESPKPNHRLTALQRFQVSASSFPPQSLGLTGSQSIVKAFLV
eukprot:CAMPEP_0171578806 /NCGR_PEP_ID=MMETSP0961-20121227/8076_1 /TAXON_ID=87120 /ORGANISM="Aurantiochytrium limacinum, Strain ATCCMYA-1381" /LENGTH=441 /DNA_ID=CAMNT_0012135191 /DNA_START=1 /DNA_END=1327 /DNA_ORIENTATION=-